MLDDVLDLASIEEEDESDWGTVEGGCESQYSSPSPLSSSSVIHFPVQRWMEIFMHCPTVEVHCRPFTDALLSTLRAKHEGLKECKPVEQDHSLLSASFGVFCSRNHCNHGRWKDINVSKTSE